jgi:outer membrane lipoprotein carrier protein
MAAAGIDQLNEFHEQVKAFKADFTQVLKDSSGNIVQESSGKVWIQRPGLFRWEYNEPYPQVIVADGRRVWIHDPELDQVTIKRADETLGNAPAKILSGKNPLTRDFKLNEINREDNLHWVTLTPKQEDSDFAEIAVAFDASGLSQLELKDNLGQRTLISFHQLNANSTIDPSTFYFTPPPGTDVIGGEQ